MNVTLSKIHIFLLLVVFLFGRGGLGLGILKVSAVVNGIRQKFPSKKWPLIVLHNKRITGRKMDAPVNKALIEKWKNADALYATPTGSNDDWYKIYTVVIHFPLHIYIYTYMLNLKFFTYYNVKIFL